MGDTDLSPPINEQIVMYTIIVLFPYLGATHMIIAIQDSITTPA